MSTWVAAQPPESPVSGAALAQDPGLLAAGLPGPLTWSRIEGSTGTLETRFGTLTIERGERCANTNEPILTRELRLDGELVQSFGCTRAGDYYIVMLKNAFELGALDVIILGADAGGSGSPPERLHLIVLDPRAAPKFEMNPAFRSSDGTQRVAVDGNRLWFDLGFEDGERKIALFDGETLTLERRPVTAAPLAAAHCRQAHRAIGTCVTRSQGRALSEYTFDRFLMLVDTATRSGLRSLRHDPGFSEPAFMRACGLAADMGLRPDYAEFEARVCLP